MNLFFLLLPAKRHTHDLEEHPLTKIHEPMHNTSDGSEFLDDAIRMKEQPLISIRENTSTRYGEGQV